MEGMCTVNTQILCIRAIFLQIPSHFHVMDEGTYTGKLSEALTISRKHLSTLIELQTMLIQSFVSLFI